MPPPSLARTQRFISDEIGKLERVVAALHSMPAATQYLIAEIVLIRAASILETAVADIAYKLAAGAVYLDGSVPLLLHRTNSMQSARIAMLTHARSRPQRFLKWTRANYIDQAVEHVIDPIDNYRIVCRRFGSTIAEIFKVRNFAAHRSTTSRTEFRSVVRMIYGRHRRLQLGYFLLSPDYVSVPNIQRYLVQIRVLAIDLTKC